MRTSGHLASVASVPRSEPRIDYPTYLDAIRSESARFREVLATADPAARVPACPDWDASDLLWHLAGVQLFWSRVVRLRPASPDDPVIAGLPEAERPESYAELLETFDDFSHALVIELERAEPTAQAWHWSPEQTVGTSLRRQAHEALIHRLDAEQTAGGRTPLDPALAADGVAELFEVMYGGEAPAWGRIERTGGGLVAFDLADAGETLWVEPCLFFGTDPDSGKNYDGPHLVLVDDPGTAAAATVRGTAADVDAWLWKRRDDSGIEVTGDRVVYDAFRAAVDPPLD
jgi:uncharacterized protein (TIGR03083 family)